MDAFHALEPALGTGGHPWGINWLPIPEPGTAWQFKLGAGQRYRWNYRSCFGRGIYRMVGWLNLVAAADQPQGNSKALQADALMNERHQQADGEKTCRGPDQI